jgi:hypothetical protein
LDDEDVEFVAQQVCLLFPSHEYKVTDFALIGLEIKMRNNAKEVWRPYYFDPNKMGSFFTTNTI